MFIDKVSYTVANLRFFLVASYEKEKKVKRKTRKNVLSGKRVVK